MKVRLTSYGLAKDANEGSDDAFAAKSWGETVIAVLADGVGGARDGREASHRIVKTLVSNYEARPAEWTPRKALAEFTRIINAMLHQESLARYGTPELISTLTVAVIEGNRLFGLNVGDSRAYLAQRGAVTQLSEDHVQPQMTHVLSRAMGLAPDVEPHFFERELSDGDIAILCSDGVSGVLGEEMLGGHLRAGAAARTVVQHARELSTAETRDDASAIVIEIAEAGRLRAVSQLPLAIPESLRRGDVIDGYELVRPFQYSDRVWLAAKDGQRWTVKFAPVDARDNETILTGFVKEMWNATRLKAPCFVEAFVPDGATARYYVMEFVEAPSLKSLLRSRRISVDEAIALGKFLGEASAFLLRHDLVHGDIKPENVLVIPDYAGIRFKLIDFGSAAEIFSVTSRAGTASYLAPERFHGEPVSERTELFAIGVTLYESLTGKFPFGEIERFQTPVFHAPKPPTRRNANIPPWLEAILLRCLSVDAVRRYQHLSELMFDLAHPERVERFHAAGAPLVDRLSPRFYRVGFWLLLAATILLLALLLGKK